MRSEFYTPEQSAYFITGAAAYTHDACKKVKSSEHRTADLVREFPADLDYRKQAAKLEELYRQASVWLDEAADVLAENKADLWPGGCNE